MRRRRLVAIVSAVALLTIGVLLLAAGFILPRSTYGREEIRQFVTSELTHVLRGKFYIGHISGNLLTGLNIDSLAIRDADDDSLFLATGRISVAYDPRDLLDKRIYLRRADVQHPTVFIRQHENGRINIREILKDYEPSPHGVKTPGRNFGDFVVIDSAHVSDGSFSLQLPWHPDDTLHGAKLDSAIKVTLAREDKEIRRIVEDGRPGFTRTWRWRQANVFAPHLRLADPDSDKFGQSFTIAKLAIDESDPPFRFRNVSARVQHRGDSLWVNVSHFDLPASTGEGIGKIWWGGDLPIRVNLDIKGDSVSLADVNWVYPTLPTTGGGTVLLHMQTERDPRLLDFKLTQMDVRTASSHLTGDMTFATGAPLLIVKDVKIRGEPANFDLLRTLAGTPFPVDWRGRLIGDVTASGGPLNHFVVQQSHVTWEDTHVPGATSVLSGSGELDIVDPAVTAFHRFDVNVRSLDLRSIEYLFPSFPRLRGFVSGTATLDSAWTDVRVSNADLFHQDGPGDPSHVIGGGRVTTGDEYTTYDLNLNTQPLSFTMLSRSYPGLPFGGFVSGPIALKGTVANLDMSLALRRSDATGAPLAGGDSVSFDGNVNIFGPRYAAHGTGAFASLDLADVFSRWKLVPTSLAGTFQLNVSGDSVADLDGSVDLDLSRSVADSLSVRSSRARVRFADGRVTVDSLRIETSAASVSASGGLGLRPGVSDSLRFMVSVDSLGGFRRYVARLISDSVADTLQRRDSLSGRFIVNGVVRGRLDSVDIGARLQGTEIAIGGQEAKVASASVDVSNVFAHPVGRAGFRLDSLAVMGVKLDSIGAVFRIADASSGDFRVDALSDNGPTFAAAGSLHRRADTLVVGLARMDVHVDSAVWHLVAPSHLARDSTGMSIDSLVMRSTGGGGFALRGRAPVVGAVGIDLVGDSVSLSNLATLAQITANLGGRASIATHVAGSRASPVISLRASVNDFRVGGLRVDRLESRGDYRDRRFDASLDLLRRGTSALRATAILPVDLSQFRFRPIDDSLHGSIRADSADFAIVEALSPTFQEAKGRLVADLDLAGTWAHQSIGGRVLVSNGELFLQNLGIRLKGIQAEVSIDPRRDSLFIRRLTAWSGANHTDSISLAGFVSFADRRNPLVGLRLDAKSFHALDKRSLATLDVSTDRNGIQLVGRELAATLSGALRIDRGSLYLPERKQQLVDLTSQDAFTVIDSSDVRNRTLIPSAPSSLVQNLRLDGVHIDIGDDVWLRSSEADIKLGGSLNVTRAPDDTRSARGSFGREAGDSLTYRLALEGTMSADRGKYILDLVAVKREFQVQKGTITFNGTADNNPFIDISALYNVKRPGQSDLGVIVHVHGPFNPYPVLDFESAESYISQTDLVSYLVTGLPSFQIQADLNQTAAQVLLPTASTLLAQSLRSQWGNWVDLQLGSVGPASAGQQAQARSTYAPLWNARFGGQTQITNNLFFSLNAGLCSFIQGAGTADAGLGGFVDAVGGKLQYHFGSNFSLEAGREPPARLLYCSNSTALPTGVIGTPPQWSMSLLHTWRF